MVGTVPIRKMHVTAKLGLGLAVVSLVLAWYGSLHAEKHLPNSPLRAARSTGNAPSAPGNWYERLWDRAEAKLFGGSLDAKILALTSRSRTARIAVEVVAFWLPFVLGIVAALLGGWAMKCIERERDRYYGNFHSVSSIMAGGLASIISGCMILNIYVWPHIPSLYW